MKIQGYKVSRLTVKQDDNGLCESWKVTGRGGAKYQGELASELREQLTARCHCVHDCCGHLNGGIWKVTERRGALIVKTHYVRNI